MMNAISLLKSDHRNLERLFDRYRSATEAKKGKILAEITRELMVHMVADENVLYPILRTAIEDGPSLVEEAVSEHESAKGLLAELEQREPGAFDADAKVATLRQAVDHHVKEEENEIFPEMAKSLATKRLNEIGAQLEKAKRSAPKRPPKSAEAKSPGYSIGGIAEAVTNRVTSIFQAKERRPPRSSTRKTARPARKAAATKK